MESLQIALLGYGKMGRMIEKAAIDRGHKITSVILKSDSDKEVLHKLSGCNIAIDFTTPEAAEKNMALCFDAHIPLVMGTTGWYANLPEIAKRVLKDHLTLFYAPNFSLGMNIAFRVNRHLARLLSGTPYTISIHEVHHVHKLDAPSGTAIKLADDIIANNPRYNGWTMEENSANDLIAIDAQRIGEVNGIHEVNATSQEDSITLRHEAFGRQGFALGAVLAAEFIHGKTGLFSMEDLLKD